MIVSILFQEAFLKKPVVVDEESWSCLNIYSTTVIWLSSCVGMSPHPEFVRPQPQFVHPHPQFVRPQPEFVLIE